MKKFVILLISAFLIIPAFAAQDKMSEEYLKNKLHLSVMNPFAEFVAQKALKKAIQKQAPGKYKVEFDGYTLSSMKKGIFKNLKITGKNVTIENIEIPYIKMQTETDYNWIDYSREPIVFLSDIIINYEMEMSEDTINQALSTEEYKKNLRKVNKKAYPLFTIENVRVKIRNNKIHIIMEYNFPIMPAKKNRTFMVSSSVDIIKHKVKLTNIGFDNAYGNLPIEKVINLVNLIDPLSFTLNIMDKQQCSGEINKIVINDDLLKINGKIVVNKSENGGNR